MPTISRIADWVATPYTIYLVLKDPAISRLMKMRAVIGLLLIFAYVISPIDIIPDFVPLSGWMDDLIVVPLGFSLVRRFVPAIDIVGMKNRSHAGIKRIVMWTVFSVVVVILLALLWFSFLVHSVAGLITG
jgi:uncharacterized membrane protein YkvA (DUF1232 family)